MTERQLIDCYDSALDAALAVADGRVPLEHYHRLQRLALELREQRAALPVQPLRRKRTRKVVAP